MSKVIRQAIFYAMGSGKSQTAPVLRLIDEDVPNLPVGIRNPVGTVRWLPGEIMLGIEATAKKKPAPPSRTDGTIEPDTSRNSTTGCVSVLCVSLTMTGFVGLTVGGGTSLMLICLAVSFFHGRRKQR